jgi:hypothetical protein
LAALAEALSRLAGSRLSYPSGPWRRAYLRQERGNVNGNRTAPCSNAFHWWIDAVGSYLVFTKPSIRIGQAGFAENDVAILGDLSSHHADLLVGSSGAVLVARAPTSVNGAAGESFLLKDGDRIRMRSVEMIYRRPVAWSQTSRLELASRHRLPRSMDAIILLGETASVGPRSDAVVRTHWGATIRLNRYQGRYWVRGPEDLKVDGRPTGGNAPLNPDSRIEGPWGCFRWEPI